MLPVIEMFSSIQGEGKFTGVPSFFIRTSGCNLRCAFKGSICDTPYSSYHPEQSLYKTMDELIGAFKKMTEQYPRTKHVVITGGEPLLHQKALSEFLTAIDEIGDYFITVETNGTMPPVTYEARFLDGEKFTNAIDLYSISPKLSTSVGTPNEQLSEKDIELHKKYRRNPKNIAKCINSGLSTQLKFVYSGPECIGEIEELLKDIKTELMNINNVYEGFDLNDIVMLMPEGITNEQLSKTRKEAAEICIQRGWSYTDRTHIIIWGDKRGV